ncbi:MAG: DciA family protein [bacterium]
MSRKKMSQFVSVAETLPHVLRRLGIEEKVVVYRAVTDWQQLVGEAIARHAVAIGVVDKTLLVVVDSPAWMTQLAFLKDQLLEKVDDHIGPGRLTDIRFVLKRTAHSA